MSTAGIFILITVVLVALAVAGWLAERRRRSPMAKFGPEYDRTVTDRTTRTTAEREPSEREHAKPAPKPLAADARTINNTAPMSMPGHEPWRIS